MVRSIGFWVVFLVLATAALLPRAAYADCATATMGNKPTGYVFHNADADVLQVCTGAGTWLALGAPGSGGPSGPTGCPNIGDTCSDGSIYAGLSPDGNVPMYTTPADAPATYRWNDSSNNYTDTSMINCTDASPGTAVSCQTGEANTAFLVGATGEPDYPFAAAEYCGGLSAHGHNDWYLPASDELNVLFNNRNSGDLNGSFNETGALLAGYYWSSSEHSNAGARAQAFNDGTQYANIKDSLGGGLSVRCVRRNTAASSCSTATMGAKPVGHVFHNTDFDVLQVCMADGSWKAIEPIGCPAGDGCNPDPCAGSPSPGTTCSDGSVYAGLSPDGNVPMYTTPADAPSTYVWNNGNTSGYVDTSMVNCTDSTPGTASSCQTGEANAAIMVSEDSDSGVGGLQPHQAAAYCDGLSAHGHSDWYLPAQDELDVLHDNKNAGDLNTTFNESGSFPVGWYWSASERNNLNARSQSFSDGSQTGYGKVNGLSVRCVRKD